MNSSLYSVADSGTQLGASGPELVTEETVTAFLLWSLGLAGDDVVVTETVHTCIRKSTE